MPYLEFADPYMLSTIAKFHIEERAATIFQYIKKDTQIYPVMEVWTKKTVKRVWYLPDKNLDTGEGVTTEIPEFKDLEIEKEKAGKSIRKQS